MFLYVLNHRLYQGYDLCYLFFITDRHVYANVTSNTHTHTHTHTLGHSFTHLYSHTSLCLNVSIVSKEMSLCMKQIRSVTHQWSDDVVCVLWRTFVHPCSPSTSPQWQHLVLGSLPPPTCRRTAEAELQRLMVLSVGGKTNRYASVLEEESERINANQLALFSII